jgi:hypothetical protein
VVPNRLRSSLAKVRHTRIEVSYSGRFDYSWHVVPTPEYLLAFQQMRAPLYVDMERALQLSRKWEFCSSHQLTPKWDPQTEDETLTGLNGPLTFLLFVNDPESVHWAVRQAVRGLSSRPGAEATRPIRPNFVPFLEAAALFSLHHPPPLVAHQRKPLATPAAQPPASPFPTNLACPVL